MDDNQIYYNPIFFLISIILIKISCNTIFKYFCKFLKCVYYLCNFLMFIFSTIFTIYNFLLYTPVLTLFINLYNSLFVDDENQNYYKTMQSVTLSILLLLIYVRLFCNGISRYIYYFLYCIYFVVFNLLLFLFYVFLILIYKYFLYILTLIIFIDLSHTLHTYNNHKVIGSNFSNFNQRTITKISVFDQQYYTQSLLVPVKGISSSESNDLSIHFILIILTLLYLLKQISNKNKSAHIFFNLMFFYFYITMLFLPTIKLNNELKYIKKCTKVDFFTFETIYELNNVNEHYGRIYISLLAISKFKYRNHLFFIFQLLLLLSGDINPNPGPQESQQSDTKWKLFEKKGLHFIHININSLLPKLDEIRSIAQKSNAAIIGITESKLDDSVPDSEVHIDNYNLIRCDRNRHGGGVACYVRDDINFNQKQYFNSEIENILLMYFFRKPSLLLLGFFIDHLTSLIL